MEKACKGRVAMDEEIKPRGGGGGGEEKKKKNMKKKMTTTTTTTTMKRERVKKGHPQSGSMLQSFSSRIRAFCYLPTVLIKNKAEEGR